MKMLRHDRRRTLSVLVVAAKHHCYVACNGQLRKYDREFRQKTKPLAQVDATAVELFAIIENVSTVGRCDGRKTSKQRRLTRPVRTQNSHDLTGVDCQGNVF